ncbi:MAG: hypothetical protein ACK4NC_00075 [Candidatus Gracilibacteria bacterium]
MKKLLVPISIFSIVSCTPAAPNLQELKAPIVVAAAKDSPQGVRPLGVNQIIGKITLSGARDLEQLKVKVPTEFSNIKVFQGPTQLSATAALPGFDGIIAFSMEQMIPDGTNKEIIIRADTDRIQKDPISGQREVVIQIYSIKEKGKEEKILNLALPKVLY